jgi:hypothetical protein
MARDEGADSASLGARLARRLAGCWPSNERGFLDLFACLLVCLLTLLPRHTHLKEELDVDRQRARLGQPRLNGLPAHAAHAHTARAHSRVPCFQSVRTSHAAHTRLGMVAHGLG